MYQYRINGPNQNIIDQMWDESDAYTENWIYKMQSVGLIKQDLSEKDWINLCSLLERITE